MAFKILLVDDDEELLEMLSELFAGIFKLQVCHDGVQARERLRSGDYDLVVLDVMLPGLDGMTLLDELRAFSAMPVIMLTAAASEKERIRGLDRGADDYLGKPFSAEELRSRIEAVLRRSGVRATAGMGRGPALTVDRALQQVICAHTPIDLTLAEFKVFEALYDTPGKPVSRDYLCVHALGRTLTPHDRSIDTHVSNLRRKLRACEAMFTIRSVRGAGYQYTAVGLG
jgi:DNA-binding response OmpR family regulator